MSEEIKIRFADISDAERLLEIYSPYVLETAVSFEYDVPTADEFAKRIENTLKSYPYLAAEIGGKAVGYAYAGRFQPRKAYCHTAEVSIYIDGAYRQKGIGKRLYGELEELLFKMNIYSICACIAVPRGESDEYLDRSSEIFHEKMGFKLVGKFHSCGCKFGRWYDMIWMEKLLCAPPDAPPEIINFSNLKGE